MGARPVAVLSHAIPGRTRIRVPARKGDEAFFARVASKLVEHPGVESLRVNVLTASILILHPEPSTVAEIARFASEQDLFVLQDEAESPLARIRAAAGVEQLDDWLQKSSGGSLDYQSVLLLIFIVMSVAQIVRGNLMAPAASMVWYAVSVVESSKNGGKRR